MPNQDTGFQVGVEIVGKNLLRKRLTGTMVNIGQRK